MVNIIKIKKSLDTTMMLYSDSLAKKEAKNKNSKMKQLEDTSCEEAMTKSIW